MKLFIFLLISFISLHASLAINDTTEKYDNFKISYLYDKDSSLDIKTIQNTNFTQTINSQFSKGYRYGNAWFKLEFFNNSKNEDFVLNFTEPIWSEFNLYTKNKETWDVDKNGLAIPLNDRSIKNATPAFSLHLNSGETTVVYVQGLTIASQIGEFELYTKNEFYNPSRITLLDWYTIYAFVLFGFIILNFYNLCITKESIYAYYIVYVFIYIIFSTMHSGIYITFGFPNWHEGLHVLGQLTLLTLLLFSIEFLELKRTFPLMKKVFLYLALGSLIFALLLSKNVLYSTIASNFYFSIVLITMVLVAIKILRDGFKGAKYYLIALVLYLPAMTMMAMNFNTFLPNIDITRYSFLAGAFVEIFFFTLILTNRYQQVNKEKIDAQGKLLKAQQRHEIELIDEIEKKTLHLTDANAKLIKQTQELEEAKKQLTIEATTDMLSGLYNRRYFFESSQHSFYTAIRNKTNLSIMLIDIDKFKNINDTYGHIIGDKVIRTVSNILKECSRESDIVARYGGEEFVVLLPNTQVQETITFAEKFRKKIQENDIHLPEEQIINTTVSVGVTELCFELDHDIESFIMRADKALYIAKQNGRNQVHSL